MAFPPAFAALRRAAFALPLCTVSFLAFPLNPAAAKVQATVNGAEITDEDIAAAGEDVGNSLPKQMDDAARKKALLDYLIDITLVNQKAAAEKLDQTPDFARKLVYLRQKLTMETYLAKITKEGVTPASEKQVYDDAAKAQKPEEEVHALHILVPTEEEAKKALARVKGGDDFGKVADELSKDPGSKGGDLGWFTKERMVPEFADVAFKTKPGELSEPVKSQFGWHVIKVLEKRQKTFPPFDEVKEQVEHFVQQKVQSEAIMKLRDTAKITRADEPATPAKPAEPAKK
jgi:peptidyl-prolyl cis-trans isomerase C